MASKKHFGIVTSATSVLFVGAGKPTSEAATAEAHEYANEATEVVKDIFTLTATSKAQAEKLANERLAFVPTDEEIAETAAIDSTPTEAETAEARTPVPAAPRSAPKTGTWWGCALDSTDDHEAMITEEPYGSIDFARRAAMLLPNSPMEETVVAIQGTDRNAALQSYLALGDVQRVETDAVHAAREATVRTSLIEIRKQPVEADQLYLSPTGLAHASLDCRFVKNPDAFHVIPSEVDGEKVLAGLVHGEEFDFEVKVSDDKTKKVHAKTYCLFCSVTKADAELATA